MANVALLGCGRIAQFFHLPILAGAKGTTLAALADADAGLLASAQAKAPKARACPTWEEALDTPDLDAAVICLPPQLHAPAAIAALDRGLHVYVEKPLALTLKEAQAVVDACPPGRLGALGFNFRRNDRYRDLRAALKAERFGPISALRFTFASPRRTLPSWKALRATGGGALRDLAVHHLDLAAFLLDESIEVLSAQERSINSEGDVAVIHARSSAGIPLEFVATQSTAHAANEVELLCEAGSVTVCATDRAIEAPRQVRNRFARPRRLWSHARELLPPRLLYTEQETSFHNALTGFARAVAAEDPVAAWDGADLQDGLAVAVLIDRIEGMIHP